MSDFSNIPGGLNIQTQIPLDVKLFKINETALADLGEDNNLAYTYYDGLKIYCFEEKTTYIWREVQTGEENTGLVSSDFTYPNNLISFGINYSLRTFNFFPIVYITTDNLEDEIGTLPAGTPGDDGLNADMTRTSTTSIAIADSGSKTLNYTASTNLGWLEGTRLRFSHDINNYMEGIVTTVSTTSVTITVDNSLGSGTYSTWNITIAGDKGVSSTPDAIVVENTEDTLTITMQDTSNLDYDLTFQLDGGKCFFTGTITNNTLGTLTNQTVFAFINTAYYTLPTYDIIEIGIGTGNVLRNILIHNTTLSIDEIESGEVVSVNGFYFTN